MLVFAELLHAPRLTARCPTGMSQPPRGSADSVAASLSHFSPHGVYHAAWVFGGGLADLSHRVRYCSSVQYQVGLTRSVQYKV